ncbi:raffinose/stachyose/melibiose transport system substrate-binding protein [Anaerotaenia torta]|uniref:ABC transporter substrate-binding protein n=1 Tax=Anaerotaenia torta TaxID=433293 RepID=UPI003D1AE391
MKKIKNRAAALLVLVLVILMAGACDKKTGAEDWTEEKAAGTDSSLSGNPGTVPVILTTASMYGGTDANAGRYQSINRQFTTDYPYITIEDDSQTSDQDWKAKIAADFAVGNEPDVIQYFTDSNASDVLAAGKFVSIAEIKEVYPDYAADILDTALEAAANPDGIQRAVPTTGYWEGLFCNKDLFDQFDLELPTDWDKLLKAIETFRENGVIPIAVSLNNVPHYWIEFFLLSAAGHENYIQIPKTAPEDWCRGLEMFRVLREMGAFSENADSIDNDYAGELFKRKDAAMQMEGSWYLNSIPDQENTVVIAPPSIPGGKAEEGSIVGGISSGFYITRKAWEDSDKRDAAVKFVMAHTNAQAIALYWGGNGQATAKVEPPKELTPLGISGLHHANSATSTSSPTDSRISQEAYSTLVAGIAKVSTGERSAKDLLDEVLEINAKGEFNVPGSNY